jgi:hypothetical protein
MATLAQKVKCEQRMRKLLKEGGLPEPDGVEYGYTCVRFFFAESRTCLVVDIDNPDEEATVEDDEGDPAARTETSPVQEVLEVFGDPISGLVSPN